MLQAPTNYLPVQQAAVQQQLQQAPIMKPASYNAVLISIDKPEVVAGQNQDPVYGMPYAPIYNYPPQTKEQAN